MLQKRFIACRKSYQLKHNMDCDDVLPFNPKKIPSFSHPSPSYSVYFLPIINTL